MERHAAQMLEDPPALPVEARSALIDSKIVSPGVVLDDDAEETWREKIARRLQQIEAGAVQHIPWQAAQRRLRDEP